MKWRYAMVAFAFLSLAGARAAVGVPQDLSPSREFTGHVDIATGEDGRLLMLIDVETSSQSSDGLVDQVFRLQEAPPLTYSGQATVTYVKNRVTVQNAEGGGWVFTVAGWPMPPAETGLTEYHVLGVARLSGDRIHKSAATLLATLSSTTCSSPASPFFGALSAASAPGCGKCATGGPGVSGCSVSCSDGRCEADCGADSYACCNCSGTCGCCSSPEGSAHH